MQDFRKLKVWEKSHALVLSIYQTTGGFPSSEVYGLTSQMRRCSSSIPSNIAEGCGRSTNADLLRFLYSAMGSAKELEYQLLLSRDLGFVSSAQHDQFSTDVGEVERMLSALIAKLRST
jgi:four helix bundle protein